ncbi:MAG: EAL and GGDEF domain-containing protein [Gammaproteobacteria bacterium]|nr:EAL and GGDEF domain-containing protein [Gammaproteobacteria bacterium]
MNQDREHDAMPPSLEACLDRVIRERRLTVLFQPIVSHKTREIYAYEALIRGPSDTPLHAPVNLFETAVRHARLVDLELLCREVSIQQFKRLNLPGKLFLNASPETLFQPDFRSGCTLDMLQRAGLSPERVVIELTEQYPLDNYDVVREALQHYKEMGFEIAIDDLGAGYAGLRMWSELRPDYVKIDRHFMQDIHEDKVKQEFVRSIRNIARELDCRVVGEGVETADEYRVVSQMGLEFFQGYYFARPTALPETRVARSLFEQEPSTQRSHGYLSKCVGELMHRVSAICATTSVEETAQIFQSAPQLESLPVVSGERPLGLVRRNTLTSLLLNRYGRELHGKKPVSRLVDSHTLMLPSHLPIEQASTMVSEQMQQDRSLDFIITEEGRYCGVGSVIDLLRVITELQVRNARYANPLTLLPGNVPIYEELDQLLQTRQPFVVAYCDLDHFKPYNDKYGYEKGDRVIKGVAEILQEATDAQRDFVGHIGGDDFIVIFRSEDWQSRCEQILQRFEARVPDYYRREDVEQAGIWAQDRGGNYCLFPLLSLSIGCVNPDPVSCKSHHDIATLASGAKHMAKQQAGNVLYIERRRQPDITAELCEAVA